MQVLVWERAVKPSMSEVLVPGKEGREAGREVSYLVPDVREIGTAIVETQSFKPEFPSLVPSTRYATVIL